MNSVVEGRTPPKKSVARNLELAIPSLVLFAAVELGFLHGNDSTATDLDPDISGLLWVPAKAKAQDQPRRLLKRSARHASRRLGWLADNARICVVTALVMTLRRSNTRGVSLPVEVGECGTELDMCGA